MEEEVYNRIVRDIRRLHIYFWVVITVLSIWSNVSNFILTNKPHVLLLVATIFWITVTSIQGAIGFYKTYEDSELNSKQVYKWIMVDCGALAFTLILTRGSFNLFPYIVAALCVYSLVIKKHRQKVLVFVVLAISFLIIYINGQTYILSLVLSDEIADKALNSIMEIQSQGYYTWVDRVSHLVLISMLLKFMWNLSRELVASST